MSAVSSGRQGAHGKPSTRNRTNAHHVHGNTLHVDPLQGHCAFTADELVALVDDLARDTEAVCRHYLSKGRRQGGYWIVGDLGNNPGRSLYVRLKANAKGAAGKFTDAATGEHGDLLDIIRETCGLTTFPDVVAEARRFLGRPDHVNRSGRKTSSVAPPSVAARPRGNASPTSPFEPSCMSEAARRLFAASQPIAGTLAELYLQRRGITHLTDIEALRFQPRCFYRLDEDDDRQDQLDGADDADDVALTAPKASPHRFLPALIAAVSDEGGVITGVQRTYLDAEALRSAAQLGPLLGKAPVPSPRRALGELLGHGVRLKQLEPVQAQTEVLAAGEGIETMLSLRMVLPVLPMIAALSAGNLGSLAFPPTLRRLYIAEDADLAGRAALVKVIARAAAAGIDAIVLKPMLDDFNDDLRRFGASSLGHHLRPQLAPEDVARFLVLAG